MDGRLLGRSASLLVAGLLATSAAQAAGTLKAFASEAEFQAQLAAWKAQAEAERRERPRSIAMAPVAEPMPAPAPAASASTAAPAEVYGGGGTDLDSISVTGMAIQEPAPANESITNVQTVGVDEGGIVKHSGDFLVVLRRGRLFTVRVGGDRLEPVGHVDAFAPGSDPDGSWYDEMLVSGDRVVVIGYSYDRGGTEVGLFALGRDGRIAHRATYHLRSDDYFSGRNYASRLIGDTLVFYSPLEIDVLAGSADAFLPAVRRWHTAAVPTEFRRMLPAQRIYRTAGDQDLDDMVLHSVTRCDLAASDMQCESTAVIGPSGHNFYVSGGSVYVWTTPWEHDPTRPNASSVFRMPQDGTAPTALRTSGSPADQMAFLETDGHLNVLVGAEADGEGMWRSQSRAGEIALLRLPLDRLGDGSDAALPGDYRPLPRTEDQRAELHNRYIGDWLVYGFGESWRSDATTPRVAWALRPKDAATPVQVLPVGVPVDRIDAMGGDGILVGDNDDALHFTSVRLDATSAALASVFVQAGAEEGDDRTHGFFYRATGDREGLVGLPVLSSEVIEGEEVPRAGVMFLRNEALTLRGIGQLDARPRTVRDDACVASCVDWYGDARPIFLGQRIFGLLGYELVEGQLDGGRIRERRRADFLPPAARRTR